MKSPGGDVQGDTLMWIAQGNHVTSLNMGEKGRSLLFYAEVYLEQRYPEEQTTLGLWDQRSGLRKERTSKPKAASKYSAVNLDIRRAGSRTSDDYSERR